MVEEEGEDEEEEKEAQCSIDCIFSAVQTYASNSLYFKATPPIPPPPPPPPPGTVVLNGLAFTSWLVGGRVVKWAERVGGAG